MSDRRRHDDTAALMWADYESGLSLAQVAARFGVTRQSVYGLFKGRGLRLRAKTRLPEIVYGGQTYTMRKSGYYAATSGDRHLLHRRMWEDAHGPIPADHDVHHRDHDKSNNARDNLLVLTKAEHTRLHAIETPHRSTRLRQPLDTYPRCVEVGCERAAQCRGRTLCLMHYKRLTRSA